MIDIRRLPGEKMALGRRDRAARLLDETLAWDLSGNTARRHPPADRLRKATEHLSPATLDQLGEELANGLDQVRAEAIRIDQELRVTSRAYPLEAEIAAHWLTAAEDLLADGTSLGEVQTLVSLYRVGTRASANP